jgi:hypothetical protein
MAGVVMTGPLFRPDARRPALAAKVVKAAAPPNNARLVVWVAIEEA